MSPRFRRFAASFLLLAVLLTERLDAATGTPPWPHEVTDVAPSPRVIWGRLDNGLRYAVLPNHTPAGQVSLRLLVEAGSLHENDHERGYAHFVEHMAFNGTRHFPAGELVKFLQRAGAAFGPHVNATTTEHHTLYKLDLPENQPATVQSGLQILRDFADGVLFEPTEVNRERGVLTNERLTRLTADYEGSVDWRATVLAGMRAVDRFPIGTAEGIKQADTTGLRAFHDAWYRPERMVVVVVGDIESAEIEKQLGATFASLSGRGAPRPDPDPGHPTLDHGTRAHFYPRRRDGLQIELGVVRPPLAVADSEARRRERLALELATRMLSRRLTLLRELPDRPLNNYQFDNGDPTADTWVARLTLVGQTTRWQTVLSTGEQALRRALEHGFEPTELAFATDSLRNALKAAAQAAPTTTTPDLAATLVDGLVHRTVFTQPDQRLELTLANLAAITTEECRDALRALWSDAPRYIYASAYPKLLTLTPAQLLAADATSRAVSVAPPEAVSDVEFAYRDFGPPGTVASNTLIPDLDVWQSSFANGVRLFVKQTHVERGRIHLQINFGHGTLDEAPNQRGLSLWVGALVQGGVAKHSAEDLRRALRGRNINGRASNRDDTSVFTVDCTSADLPDALRLATAFLSDPAFRADATEPLRLAINDVYRAMSESPAGVVQRDIVPFLAGGAPALTPAPLKTAQAYTMDQVSAWLRPTLQSRPLDITFVGDIEPEKALALVATTFGALPDRAPDKDVSKQRVLHFPQPPQSKTFHYGATVARPDSLVFSWPVNTPPTPADRRSLRLLAEILKDRLRIAIREEKGKTYTVAASFYVNDAYPGLADIRCQFDVEHASARRVIAQVKKAVNELARSGVATDELARARAQAVAGVRQQLQTNTYWQERLARAHAQPERLDDLRGLEHDYANATKADLDRLAALYLTEKNLFDFRIEAVKAK